MKSWVAIPVLGLVAASLAALAGTTFGQALCAGLAAAAIVHALRSLAGDSPAALVGAGTGALLAAVSLVDRNASVTSYLALGSAAWTFAELARPNAIAYVALAPAVTAAILEPACVALVAIAGTRLLSDPRRWMIAVPIAGAIAVVVAIVAGSADGGAFGALGDRWYGARGTAIPPRDTVALLGNALGPLAITAALGGLVTLVRVHLASLAIVACAGGALLCDLRSGAPSAFAIGFAGLCAGAAVGRLAGMIRLRHGQAIAGATFGTMLLVPPLWSSLIAL